MNKILLSVWSVSLAVQIAHGVVLFGTSDPTANTTPPTGALANSGWQYQAFYGDFLCTPISPTNFITAKHVSGGVGQLIYNGRTFQVASVTAHPDPNVDLAVGRIIGTFPSFAKMSTRDVFRRVDTFQIFSGFQLPSQQAVVHGRGGPKGVEVYNDSSAVPCSVSTALRGWMLSGADGVERWGAGSAVNLFDKDPNWAVGLDYPISTSEIWKFFTGESPNDFALSTGDSGGGLFVSDQGEWRLAGLNSGIYSTFKVRSSDNPILAAIFNSTGLWIPVVGGVDGWAPMCDYNMVNSTYAYLADVQWNLAWIESNLGGIRLNRMNYDPAQGFGFEIGGAIDGTSVIVETTSDLQTWQQVGSAAVQGWRYFFTDSNAGSSSVQARFYRARNSGNLRSDNCVGFYKFDLNNSSSSNTMWAIVANQFVSYHGDDLNALIPTAPLGTKVYKYDPVSAQYTTSTFVGGGGYYTWSPDLAFTPGEGFWIAVPAYSDLSLVFYGELQQAFTRTIYPGQNLISLPIPRNGLPSAEFGFSPVFGDNIFRWVNGAYQSLTYFGDWYPNNVAQPGEGFWYASGTAAPFVWSFSFSVW